MIISRRLARPIHNITESAAQLAEGNYNITFDGSGYAETEELAATLNYTSYELSKSDKLQKDLVANVSHDLKTPLTMVKSYAEMIRDLSGDNPEKRARHLQVIINEADRLNNLVNDLTMLSKMQANVDVLNAETIDLAYIARESMESFSIHSEQHGFDFNIDVEGNPCVTADEKKIRQVFSNLIGNAVRYSGDNKKIEITIKELDKAVRCEITDHGQGIAAEDIESIWDRYYQSSSNHSRTSKGSGLGLSIVKQIFILHDAKYGVNSVENEGSTFWFELKKQQEDK
jgi:signal transduction histidine kinase